MSHNDKIRDTETHFIINPETRAITNAIAANNIIVQYDHNSERFTFEIPRYVDGHDMFESTSVRIHYRNSSSNQLSKTNGMYVPDDLSLSDDSEDVVTFSWLLSAATTQYIGFLHFSIQFICLDGETVEYAWNTGVYKDITIIESINNTEEEAIEVVDAVEGIKYEVTRDIEANLADTLTELDEAIENSEAVAATLTLAKENGEFVGEKGDKGDTGVGIESIKKKSTDGLVDIYVITYTNGDTFQYEVANGARGADGISASHSWNGTTLSVTSASGTSSVDLKGEKGDKGDKGDKGADGTVAFDDLTDAQKEWLKGESGVYVGSDNPDSDANVWIDPDGDPTGTEEWSFTLEDGTTIKKTVVVIG